MPIIPALGLSVTRISPEVQGQPGLQSEILSQNKTSKIK